VYMFLWIPVAGEQTEAPTIDKPEKIVKAYSGIPSTDDTGDDNQIGRQNNDPLETLLKDAHPAAEGWVEVLAWSHGCSNSSTHTHRTKSANLQDISITKWQDKSSPGLMVMVMRSEVMPKVVLRILSPVKGDVFHVTEIEFNNANITSISLGGSGGERRLTENISISFQAVLFRVLTINKITGDVVSQSKGFWDDQTKEGIRAGKSSVASLRTLSQSVVAEYVHMFERPDLARLPKNILTNIGIEPSSLCTILPMRGRKILVTEKRSGNQPEEEEEEYREVYVKTLTKRALFAAVAQKFSRPVDDIASINRVDDKCLVVLEADGQVKQLAEEAIAKVRFK